MSGGIIDNPENAFSMATFPDQYRVRLEVKGVVEYEVRAASMAEAVAMVERDIDTIEAHGRVEINRDVEVFDVDVEPRRPRFLVLRNGKKMRVSRLEKGDLPREPDERGF